MNHLLFKIGFFPLIGIALILVFLEPSRQRQIFRWISSRWRRRETVADSAVVPLPDTPALSWPATVFVIGYLSFQALWPLRIFGYRDDPSWTDVGQSFSWRMMLRHKDAFMQLVFDPTQAERFLEQHPEIRPKISQAHVKQMVTTPHFILQYSHALSDVLRQNGWADVKIRCVAVASMNGRPYQLMIDPKCDLATASYGLFEVPDWILPLDKHRRAGLYPETTKQRTLAIREVTRAEFPGKTRQGTEIQQAGSGPRSVRR